MIARLWALSWLLVLAGVGMHWAALAWLGGAAFVVFGGVWCVLLARARLRAYVV